MYQNIYKRGGVCQLLEPRNVGKRHLLAVCFEFVLHISVGLLGPLRTPLELKIVLPTPIVQPDAATLTLHAIKCLKRLKTSKDLFEHLQQFQQIQNGKSGGLDVVGSSKPVKQHRHRV